MYNPTKPYRKRILELIQSTWDTPYVSVEDGIYPILTKRFSSPEVVHTDGIGTKGVYHWQKRTFDWAVLDALAMNLNDLALVRAQPYALQNHIVLPEDDDEAVLKIVKALSEECKKRQIAITGGETSIHNTSDGMDISITVSGFIKRQKPNQLEVGDVLVGIRSNGLHANGFTKVREIFRNEWRDEFVAPTRIYHNAILSMDEKYDIHGMMHITGGAFTKLKPLISNKTDIVIKKDHNLHPQEIFKEIYACGVSDKEMYTLFNCGIGFVLSVSPKDASKITDKLSDTDIIGEVIPGRGNIKIESAFSKSNVVL